MTNWKRLLRLVEMTRSNIFFALDVLYIIFVYMCNRNINIRKAGRREDDEAHYV